MSDDQLLPPDRITKAVAMRLAQLELPDSHTLDDRLNAPWYRYIYEAEQVLEAIREAESGEPGGRDA